MPSETVWTKYRNMIVTGYSITDSGSVDTYGRYARAQGGTTAIVPRSDLIASTSEITTKMQQGVAGAGIQVLPQPLLYNRTVGSPTQLAAAIRTSGADVLPGALSVPERAAILPAVIQSGAQIKVVLTPGAYDSRILLQYGVALAHLSTFLSYVPFETAGDAHKRYLAAMAKYALETDPKSGIALTNHIQADLFLRGLQAAGAYPTRPAGSRGSTIRAARRCRRRRGGPGVLFAGPGEGCREPECVRRRVDRAGRGAPGTGQP
ncbi:ABC transporter substrate-binding protein [Frankia sp. AgB32]|nr:ABC transporter substrate-binding protein [Frankia sp. AgB32]